MCYQVLQKPLQFALEVNFFHSCQLCQAKFKAETVPGMESQEATGEDGDLVLAHSIQSGSLKWMRAVYFYSAAVAYHCPEEMIDWMHHHRRAAASQWHWGHMHAQARQCLFEVELVCQEIIFSLPLNF